MARTGRFSRKSRFSRFRRFRRGARGTWFPTLGTFWGGEGGGYSDASFSDTSLPVGADRSNGPVSIGGTNNITVIPVTKDFTAQPDPSSGTLEYTLRDEVEGQTWRLDRLVGKIHVRCGSAPGFVDTTRSWGNIQVSAGFFTARSEDDAEAFPDLVPAEYDPLNILNIQNSWIWRRTWILQNPLTTNIGFSAAPCCNDWMSDLTGSYIDTKVKRNIKREHRLWFAIAPIGWNGNQVAVDPQSGDSQPSISWNLDLRIFGKMTRGRNSSSF